MVREAGAPPRIEPGRGEPRLKSDAFATADGGGWPWRAALGARKMSLQVDMRRAQRVSRCVRSDGANKCAATRALRCARPSLIAAHLALARRTYMRKRRP